ncbi:magnesium transporter [bacterium endosymbiont of Pedicinus badii]|uniref:magnesium transporter n=1 Tax=bacterium endosymbiont of Pedicinus badii TaxID=1719126 RepID=UPI0009BB6FC5|nr:magnesium transporter [bacterium endosymbiont of Pedicinus badii]OQM34279.1 hypothetical protein AOQ89_00045 [bacterium endosymbiont of Pedicinus badii]
MKFFYRKSLVVNYINRKYITILDSTSIKESKNYILKKISDDFVPIQIYVVNYKNYLVGVVPLKFIFLEKNDSLPIFKIAKKNFFSLDITEVCKKDLSFPYGIENCIPITKKKKIIGEFKKKKVLQILKESNFCGKNKKRTYLETSFLKLWKKRIIWLMLLFVTESYTSLVLRHFSYELEKVISLSFFIPLLIGTGGNVGSQIVNTITVAMSQEKLEINKVFFVLKKEVLASFLVAVCMGSISTIRVLMLGINYKVGIVVFVSLFIIVIWTSIISTIIPIFLKHLKIDPTNVSNPFVSTLIDGTGLIIYFEVAKIFLLNYL